MGGCSAGPSTVGGDRQQASEATASIHRLLKQSLASDTALTHLVAETTPGCSAAVGRDGEVLWAAARGLADPSNGEHLSPTTEFEVASVAKQFTAAVVLDLQRDGLLSLDDPVARHVTGLPGWATTVTIEQLMHHTARLPDFWIELERQGLGFSDPADQSRVLAVIARVDEPLDGEGYSYANSHYVLLAAIIESVTGEPFAAAMQSRVLQPLGLTMRVEPDARGVGVAVGHEADGLPVQAAWTAYGHAGIVTTPSELVRWGVQYAPGGLMEDATAGAVDDGSGERYGAGIRIAHDGSLYHLGRWGGSVSSFWVSADRSLAIAVACNQRDAARLELAEALQAIWRGER